MKLSRASSYAIHALAYMAAQKHNEPIPSHKAAQSEGIPEGFLLIVLKPLVPARILHSVKGPNGGYRLAKSPREITLLDIIEAVDGPIRGQNPFTDQRSNGALNRKLENICKHIAVQTCRQRDLGGEALQENSDWLIPHRDRPLEANFHKGTNEHG